MNKIYLSVDILALLFYNCKNEPKPNAQQIIDKAIQVSGGKTVANATISFVFRNKNYTANRKNGSYRLVKEFKDSINNITDILSNTGFKRFINSKEITVPDSLVSTYSNSVNSVHYFATLPYGLNDTAVNKTYIETTTIKNKKYYKIQVTFNEENGGDDFDDVFLYWFNTENFKLDYLAYKYHVNGGGMRFREAFNQREINGVLFNDYNNYKSENKETSLYDLDSLFEAKQLKLLSKIELNAIEVN